MIDTFPNDIISDYFKNIRKLLYVADGRSDLPPKNPLDFREINTYNWNREDITDPNISSLIKISPNTSILEVFDGGIHSDFYKDFYKKYENQFLKLPMDIIKGTEDIEIDYSFYKYSFMDKKDLNVRFILYQNVIDNFFMRRSDFVYKSIYSRYSAISNNYQKCIKSGRKYFQLNKNASEEIILRKLIDYYSVILDTKNVQLELFIDVKIPNNIAVLFTKILIEFLTIKLHNISSEIDKYEISDSDDLETNVNVEESIVYELPEKFSLSDLKIKSKALDIRETSILFYYLRKHNALLDFSDASYSKLVKLLTGHSDSNVRQRSGFGNINEILNQKRNGEKYYNTRQVIVLLEKIISDLKKNIKE